MLAQHLQQHACGSTQLASPWPAQLACAPLHNIINVSRRGSRLALQASGSGTSSVAQKAVILTCRRCRQQFNAAANSSSSCRYHPALFTGGEVAKAIGFVRASDAPEHQLEQVVGRKGLMRFWDCCGCEDEAAPGCCSGFHIVFDDELNKARGWK